ncbi:hypothetical protein ABZ752_09615 [Streptomyces roseifaciens]
MTANAIPNHQVRLTFTDFVLDPADPNVMRKVVELRADVLTFTEGVVTLWLEGTEVGTFPDDHLSAVELPSASSPDPRAYAVEEIRKQYANAYQRWSPEDEELLLERHAAGDSIEALAERFARQPSAIRSRLDKLGVEEASVNHSSAINPPF